MIAHPPCTFMSKAWARWMFPTAWNLSQERFEKSQDAKDFFMKLLNAPIKHIAVENPTPLKVVWLPEYSQAIQPYEYWDAFSKRTLLWTKNLPKLIPTNILKEYKPYMPSNTWGKKRWQKATSWVVKNQKEASKTFPWIAKAIANQYIKYLTK